MTSTHSKGDHAVKPGIHTDITNEDYHAGPGISKTGLWTIATRSPLHYRFGQRKEKKHFDFGEACHLAVLQPELFEQRVYRGPEDRRGNKWKDVVEYCQIEDKLPLTSGDYDEVLAIRDVIHADPWIHSIITGGAPMVEASGYWTDPETDTLCRCRPDLYREDLGIILDVKSAHNAHPETFDNAVVNYGYHAQEAFYSDGWRALGKPVEGFVFLAFEKEPPYAYAVYELPPSIVEEGRAIIRRALTTYAECEASGEWPGYGKGVQELSFKRWAYRLTEAPSTLDEAVA